MAIETSRGLLVAALRVGGRKVFAIAVLARAQQDAVRNRRQLGKKTTSRHAVVKVNFRNSSLSDPAQVRAKAVRQFFEGTDSARKLRDNASWRSPACDP